MTKSTKKQNIGGKAGAKGSVYQAFSATFLALRMLLYDDYKTIKPNAKGPIDDIQAKDEKDNDVYFQCKVGEDMPHKGPIKDVLRDFYSQYILDSENDCVASRYILFCLYSPPRLNKILEKLDEQSETSQTPDEYLQEELPQNAKELYEEVYKDLSKQNKGFVEQSLNQTNIDIDSDKSYITKESLSKKEYTDFLKRIEVWTHDFRGIKDNLYKPLECWGYPKYVYHILNTTFLHDWSSREIKKEDIDGLLKDLGVEVVPRNIDMSSVKPLTKRKEYVKSKTEFILLKVDEMFYKKLQFMLELIPKNDFPKNKRDFIIEALIEDNTLSWHFLRNLSDLDKPGWFPKIKDNVIKSIVEQDEDTAVKFQLFNYFETCAPEHSDQILPLIDELERNTKNYNILSNLVKTLGKMCPESEKNIKLLWKIFSRLTEHQHPWVRREIPNALLSFADKDIDKTLKILKKVLLYTPPPQDVTQGSPTHALTFQGRDNENWVFEEAVKALSGLLNNPEYADKAFDLAIEIEREAIQSDRNHSKEHGIIRDYSYIWLSVKSFEKLEYNCNRKERVALEIEKVLDKFAESDEKLALQLIKKLLSKNCEVFYLITFRILQNHKLKLEEDLKSDLDKVAEEIGLKEKVKKPPVMTPSWSGPRPKRTTKELQDKSDNELVQLMISSSSGKKTEPYDLAPVFAELVKQTPDRLKTLLSEMKGKKIAPDFASKMVRSYIQENPDEINKISDLFSLLSPTDTLARMEFARYFNEICRKPEIQDYEEEVLEEIKTCLISLSEDSDPEHDRTIKSNNPRPEDAITRGINSVRGVATEALVAFYHYFSDDDEVAKRVESLADDNTNAVKATLIYNLTYLISKDYSLCEKIVNKFKNQRDAEIDFALIHFFAKLDCQKFIEQEDFIKSLFENEDEKINEKLGELIGYRYVNCCDIQNLVNEVVGGRKGTKSTQRSLAFVFESQLPSVIENDKGVIIASYLKELLKPQNSFEVVERASFLFERDEIKPEDFRFLDNNGLFNQTIENKRNIPAQSHLVNYLSKCIEADVEKERCLEVLHKQVKDVEPLLSDHLIAKKVAGIVHKLIGDEIEKESRVHLVEIFDSGLERGWDEFYSLYFDFEETLNAEE
jgi:hypothetical protein